LFVDAALFILHCSIHKSNYQVSFVRLGTLPTFQVIYCLLISNITSKNYWYLFFCYSINYSISSPKQSQRRIIPKANHTLYAYRFVSTSLSTLDNRKILAPILCTYSIIPKTINAPPILFFLYNTIVVSYLRQR